MLEPVRLYLHFVYECGVPPDEARYQSLDAVNGPGIGAHQNI
jgi:hypothetical protein